MRAALDTNVLAYAEGLNGPEKQRTGRDLVARLAADEVLLPVQALGELYAVLTRKAGRTPEQARAAVESWRAAYDAIPTTAAVLQDALEIASQHRLGVWDSVIVAAASRAGCGILYSEDMEDGFVWRGLRILNPFGPAGAPAQRRIGP